MRYAIRYKVPGYGKCGINVSSCHFFLKLHVHFKNIKMGEGESIAYKKYILFPDSL